MSAWSRQAEAQGVGRERERGEGGGSFQARETSPAQVTNPITPPSHTAYGLLIQTHAHTHKLPDSQSAKMPLNTLTTQIPCRGHPNTHSNDSKVRTLLKYFWLDLSGPTLTRSQVTLEGCLKLTGRKLCPWLKQQLISNPYLPNHYGFSLVLLFYS